MYLEPKRLYGGGFGGENGTLNGYYFASKLAPCHGSNMPCIPQQTVNKIYWFSERHGGLHNAIPSWIRLYARLLSFSFKSSAFIIASLSLTFSAYSALYRCLTVFFTLCLTMH